MDPLYPAEGQRLVWEPSKTAKRAYELRDGERLVATAVRPGFWKQGRVVTTLTDRWTLTWQGMTGSKLIISDEMGSELAQMAISGWKNSATLTFTSGDAYTWRSDGFWSTSWSWLDQSGQVVANLRPGGVWRWRCSVTIGPASASSATLALLAAVGLSLIQIRASQIAAITAATAAR